MGPGHLPSLLAKVGLLVDLHRRFLKKHGFWTFAFAFRMVCLFPSQQKVVIPPRVRFTAVSLRRTSPDIPLCYSQELVLFWPPRQKVVIPHRVRFTAVSLRSMGPGHLPSLLAKVSRSCFVTT